ncbi:MAG TPA: Mg2+ and Co2+ transporter CorB [Eubacteriales bacterium]|nr:Mg2+ and Co2+ transporter CorB [Eubacteriales bacterium]
MSKKDADLPGTIPEKTIGKNEKNDKNKKTDKSRQDGSWIIIVLLLTLGLSFLISFITELIYMAIDVSLWRIFTATILVLIIIFISIISDMMGVAATAADEEPFLAMASRKIKGAKKAVMLCRNADKVSSILNDIIGDVCGIISGASGAAIAAVVVSKYSNISALGTIFISVAVSALIATITITGKAVAKRNATKNANEITLSLAKFLSILDKDK